MPTRSGIVTLTTDFGRGDAYVAALEAALIKTAPAVRVVHVSHDVPPGDVATAAYLVEYASRSFPPGTVHLAVVDPGVGSSRLMHAVDAGETLLVGPDNGVLARALRGRRARAVKLRLDPEGSATFESRDVMAPAAGRLAAGDDIDVVGEPVSIPPVAEAPALGEGDARVAVAHVDHYGNVVVDRRVEGSPGEALLIDGAAVPFARTFSDVAEDELVAYRGSLGYLELAVRNGRADKRLGLGPGGVVEVRVPDA